MGRQFSYLFLKSLQQHSNGLLAASRFICDRQKTSSQASKLRQFETMTHRLTHKGKVQSYQLVAKSQFDLMFKIKPAGIFRGHLILTSDIYYLQTFQSDFIFKIKLSWGPHKRMTSVAILATSFTGCGRLTKFQHNSVCRILI